MRAALSPNRNRNEERPWSASSSKTLDGKGQLLDAENSGALIPNTAQPVAKSKPGAKIGKMANRSVPQKTPKGRAPAFLATPRGTALTTPAYLQKAPRSVQERRSRTVDRGTEEPPSPSGSTRGSTSGSVFQENRSAYGDNEADGESTSSSDNVKVLVRIRPITAAEAAEGACVEKSGSKSLTLQQPGHELQNWAFDYVAGDSTTQEEMFQVAGHPIVENCIAGYNSSIFAYGQTGAGKTHTMQGSLDDHDPEQRGLSFRVFEWLFKRIAEEESTAGRDNLRYTCKCSFLEIYNETITDLLKPGSSNLQLREDVTRGCFVDGLTEEIILNVEEATALIHRGSQNRKIGHTRMNQQSSRSHSVFTCCIESTVRSKSGITNLRFSRLNLVDLAGSERNKSSGARGEHFKEACLINQSLTALGRVIMELVDSQRHRKQTHIPYRDSRLTFLLQDSLGGNAKSMIIANISPAATSCHETLSTLQFVSRAKMIRNKAVVNQDTQALSAEILKRELQRLYRELEVVRSTTEEPLILEVTSLTAQLAAAKKEADAARAAASAASSEARLARTGAQWAEDRVAGLESEKQEVQSLLARLLEVADGRDEGRPSPSDLNLAQQLSLVEEGSLLLAQRLQTAESRGAQAEAQRETMREQLTAVERRASEQEERLQQREADALQARTQAAEAEARSESLASRLEEVQDEQRQALLTAQQEKDQATAKLERHRAEAQGLERQVVAIGEEVRRKDEAQRQELLACQEALQQMTEERDTLQESLAKDHEAASSLTAALAEERQARIAEGSERTAEEDNLRSELGHLSAQLQDSRSAQAAKASEIENQLAILSEEHAKELAARASQLQAILSEQLMEARNTHEAEIGRLSKEMEESTRMHVAEKDSLEARLAEEAEKIVQLDDRMLSLQQAVDVERASRESLEGHLRSEIDSLATRLQEAETGQQADLQRSQVELAEVIFRMEAAEKLAGKKMARAEALAEDLARQKADIEAQHHVILGLQQELGDFRNERDQALQECEEVRMEVRTRVEEVQCMRESSRVLEEQHAAERAEADATVASLMEEVEALKEAVRVAKQAEEDAIERSSSMKAVLGSIVNVANSARSPNGTPRPNPLAGFWSMPSPKGSTNPLFVAHRKAGSTLSQSQEWTSRGGLLDPSPSPGSPPPGDDSQKLRAGLSNLGSPAKKPHLQDLRMPSEDRAISASRQFEEGISRRKLRVEVE